MEMKARLIGFVTACVMAGGALAHNEQKHEQKAKAAQPLSTEETAFGREGDPKKVSRTIKVDMTEMRFAPAQLTVKQGETIRFVLKNSGQLMHEMVLGRMEDLKHHAELMRKHPEMEHDEPHMAHVAAGKSGSLVWQFTKAGEFHYGCLIPGHFESGMVGKIKVTAAQHQPYSGQQERELKALSAEEIKQYLSGAGMGYAKAAELNHFPGPQHALEFADQLGLGVEQRAATKRLLEAHKAEARAIGAKLVQSERALDALFRGGAVTGAALAKAVREAAALEGEYRLSHLETHRRLRALLSDEQIAGYDRLRGYAQGERSQHKH